MLQNFGKDFPLSDFVNHNHLGREKIHQLATERIAISGEHVRVDELNGASWKRVPSTKPIKEVLELILTSDWMHCAERDNELCVNVKENDIEYFLWIGRNTYYDKE